MSARMRPFRSATFGILLLLGVPATAAPWTPEQSQALNILLVDGETGSVLYEKDPAAAFPPASLAKLMTMEVVFEALDAGTLKDDTTFTVSEHAWRTGGAPSGTSTMFAKPRSEVPLEALIRGVTVQAANDAAIAIAEGMAGSEADFAKLMNARAQALGMHDSAFANPTGLPAEGQHVSARDLVTLARHMVRDHPERYRVYSEPEFTWNDITQRNRNPLLRLDVGATGLSTGYTERAGYSLVGVIEKNGRRTFLVLGGLPSIRARENEARDILEWADRSFRREKLFEADATVGTASIYGGLSNSVAAVVDEPVVVFVPNGGGNERVSARLVYDGPLRAPISAGQRIGQIEVMVDDTVRLSRDVFAVSAVGEGSFASRALGAAQELAFGWIRAL